MDQLTNFADDRLLQGCTYCDSVLRNTKDHVPSKIFLDSPFPENLPVVWACDSCNNGFSRDEEYLACLIECVLADSTDRSLIKRSRVAARLSKSPALRARIEATRTVSNGRSAFIPEPDRVRNVLRKLALGHAAYELSTSGREPASIQWWPLLTMTPEQQELFNAPYIPQLFGEVGSRGMQRTLLTTLTLEGPNGERSEVPLFFNDWIEVQEGRYRYLAIDDADGIRVKIVISEYLACEVVWADN